MHLSVWFPLWYRVLKVDGFDAAGERIYDRVSGKTCHQCRQKTIGKRTHCRHCNTADVRPSCILLSVYCRLNPAVRQKSCCRHRDSTILHHVYGLSNAAIAHPDIAA